MKWILMAALTLFVWLEPLVAADRPNFVLCMADDHGWGDTGYNGNKIIRTPHLDQMVADGMRFDRFYAACPVCSPTRGSFLTGRHPTRYGIPYANTGSMPAQEVTMGEALQSIGYRTGHFGKWHLGTLTKAVKDGNRGGPGGVSHYAPPWDHGFDTCFSTESKVPTFWEQGAYEKYGTRYWTGPERMVSSSVLGDDSAVLMKPALDFISDSVEEGKPFVAIVWFHTPHKPIVTDPNHADGYDAKLKSYYSGLTALDVQMGELRAHLEKLGVTDNTLVLYTSDNGPERGTPGDTSGLRMRKRSLYEGGVRVPGVMVWPGKILPGSVTEFPASTSDLLPTVLDFAGQWPGETERPMDGISLKPVLTGKMTERTEPIAFSCPRSGQQALIDNDWKLYSQGGKDELYNLKADRGEKKDIAGDHAERLANMRKALDEFLSSCKDSSAGMDYGKKGVQGLLQ